MGLSVLAQRKRHCGEVGSHWCPCFTAWQVGWWRVADNTEATPALQSPLFCIMGAGRDQMGHKCAPKLQGRCTLWCTLWGLSSDHLDRGTCWTSDKALGNSLGRQSCIRLLRNALGSHSSNTASDTPVSSHPCGDTRLSRAARGTVCAGFSACHARPCCTAPTAPPAHYCLQKIITH